MSHSQSRRDPPCFILPRYFPRTDPIHRLWTAQHSFARIHTSMEPLASPGPIQFDSSSDRTSRSKTVFQIAQPPPSKKLRTRLRRPRILLQLQQLSEHRRPLPVLDVLPSSYFAPRLAQRFPKIFKGKDSLGPNDIIVTNSNSSGGVPQPGQDASLLSDDEACDSCEVVGTICRQTRKPHEDSVSPSAEICLDQGLVWKATPLPRGGYEFNATGADGSLLQARWVRRDRPNQRRATLADTTSAASQAAKRFTFSILNPSARRHPVIASMTNESIEVHDQYPAAVAQNTPKLAPTSPASILSHETSYFDIQDLISQPKEPLIHTDHHLRSLIVVTGIYVSLEEGLAEGFYRSQRRTRDQGTDSASVVESKAPTTKLGRASTQIFHRHAAVAQDATHVEAPSQTLYRATPTQAASVDSSNRWSFPARLRRAKDDHEAIVTGDGVDGRSDDSSRPNSNPSPPYSRFSEGSELLKAGASVPFETSRFANANVQGEKASIVRSASTKSTRMFDLRGRSDKRWRGFRRFFSLPCIGPAPVPENI